MRGGSDRLLHVPLEIPGDHNRDNAACAVALARWCGVSLDDAAVRLAAFRGVGRRFEERGTAGQWRAMQADNVTLFQYIFK